MVTQYQYLSNKVFRMEILDSIQRTRTMFCSKGENAFYVHETAVTPSGQSTITV